MTLLGDPDSRRGMRLLGRTLLSYRRESTLAILSALLWMVLVVVGPYLEKLVIDRAILPDQPSLLLPLVGLVVLVGLFKAVGIGGRRFFGFVLSYRAETDLRNRLFEHVQRLAFSFHDRVATGELMARASTDLSQVRLVFAMLPITVANIGLVAITVVVLILLDPLLGVVSSLAIPVLFLLAARYARRVTRLSFDVQQRLADLASVVEEGISGIRVVKAFGAEAETVRRVDGAADGIFRTDHGNAHDPSGQRTHLRAGPGGGNPRRPLAGGIHGHRREDHPRRLRGIHPVPGPLGVPAANDGMVLRRASPSIGSRLPDPPAPRDGSRHNRPRETAPSPRGQRGHPLCRRRSSRTPRVHRFSPGSTSTSLPAASLAVVGGAGSGKTSLAYLIPRFYDVTSGATLIDGVDVRHLRLDELRREVAIVFEDPFLFSSSIRENIAFGAPDATDEQVRLAARLARAHEFIVALPDGYDTVVGERGYTLSGGQRQRVALARAVLRDPRVLILDDATSSVDAVTERQIREALEEVMAGRTTLIIAHRTSTLALADRVALVDEGRVVAVGTPSRTTRDRAPLRGRPRRDPRRGERGGLVMYARFGGAENKVERPLALLRRAAHYGKDLARPALLAMLATLLATAREIAEPLVIRRGVDDGVVAGDLGDAHNRRRSSTWGSSPSSTSSDDGRSGGGQRGRAISAGLRVRVFTHLMSLDIPYLLTVEGRCSRLPDDLGYRRPHPVRRLRVHSTWSVRSSPWSVWA